jgi:uncharacterized protein DUF4386
MSAENTAFNPVDPEKKWLYRVGGISALAIAIGYIVIIALYVPMGAPPSGGEARLAYIGANTAAWWAILWVSVVTDLLFVPVALALYVALKGIHKHLMRFATILVMLFVILDLAITWPNHALLILLSGRYAAATGSESVAILGAANYAALVLESGLLGFYIILIPGLGILLTGLVMLKSVFNTATAYLGIATGIFAAIAVVGPLFVSVLGTAAILASILTLVWLVFVGVKLLRLG